MKRKMEENYVDSLSSELNNMKFVKNNDRDVDKLISKIANCDLEEIDEYLMLSTACKLKKGGMSTLLETQKRYDRYLSEITIWDGYEFIKDQIESFMKYQCKESKDVLCKLKMMKSIDNNLFRVLNDNFVHKKVKSI